VGCSRLKTGIDTGKTDSSGILKGLLCYIEEATGILEII
jgi:hypothetical protein